MKKTLKEFSADIYQTLIEKNADGLVIVDAEGSIQFLNPAAISLLKRTETELLGQSFGFPIVSKRHTEFDILRPGGIVTVEMSAAKIEWKGQTSFLVSLRDVSGRNKIYALASRLAAIVDSSQDAILSIDLDGIVLTWNRGAEHLYGYQEKEMVGRSCIVLYSAANREEFALAIASLKMGKPSEPYETVQVTKQGVVIEVACILFDYQRCDRDGFGRQCHCPGHHKAQKRRKTDFRGRSAA